MRVSSGSVRWPVTARHFSRTHLTGRHGAQLRPTAHGRKPPPPRACLKHPRPGPNAQSDLRCRAGASANPCDIAHGHAESVGKTIARIKQRLPQTFVIAGNVATPEAVIDLKN